MPIIGKKFIRCAAAPREGQRPFYNTVGEILKIEKSDGGHFEKLIWYATPDIQFFVNEPKADTGNDPSGDHGPQPNDFPF